MGKETGQTKTVEYKIQEKMNFDVLSNFLESSKKYKTIKENILENRLNEKLSSPKTINNQFSISLTTLKDFKIVLDDNELNTLYSNICNLLNNKKEYILYYIYAYMNSYQLELNKFNKDIKSYYKNEEYVNYKENLNLYNTYKKKLELNDIEFIDLIFESYVLVDIETNTDNDFERILMANNSPIIKKDFNDLENIVLKEFLIKIDENDFENQKNGKNFLYDYKNHNIDLYNSLKTMLDQIDMLLRKIVLNETIEIPVEYKKDIETKRKHVLSNECGVVETFRETYMMCIFKETLMYILDDNIESINIKDIKKNVIDKLSDEYLIFEPKQKNQVASNMIRILDILGFIEKDDKGKRISELDTNDYETKYKILPLKDKEYKLSLKTKITCLGNLFANSIGNFSQLKNKADNTNIKEIAHYIYNIE